MIHLKSVSRRRGSRPLDAYPFNVPVIAALNHLEFRRPVTFFVGENGSGKSTLLEAIAAGIGAITVGGDDIQQDVTMAPVRNLSGALTYNWHNRTRRGFFLRAEDFFNFAKNMKKLSDDLEALEAEYEEAYQERPFGEGLRMARGAARGQRAALAAKYGEDLNANSHGESFLKLFQSRLVPHGLYLLDEPEAPLSPLRQLAFLSLLKTMVGQQCQFIIATHSPLLMAFPDAAIINFDGRPVCETPYDEIEHVSLTRAFLADPGSFLRRL